MKRCLVCSGEVVLGRARNRRTCSPKCSEIRKTYREGRWRKSCRSREVWGNRPRRKFKHEYEVVSLTRVSSIDRAVRLLFAH